ncbi:MAG: NYN domain-containing protein [Thermostichales cyanobacterium BF4_bins_65]
MNPTKINQSHHLWAWGGSLGGLLVAIAMRQVVLGLVPMGVMLSLWQRQQIQTLQQRQHYYYGQLQQQLQTLSLDYYQSLLHQLQDRQQSLQGDLDQHQQQTRQQFDQLSQALDKLSQTLTPRRQPLGIFIDAANINHSARVRNGGFDYPQLIQQLLGHLQLVDSPQIFFYSGYRRDCISHGRLKRDLERAGFTVCMQPVTQFSDGSSKANLDGQMIVDMLEKPYDRVLLLSGDGDFLPALQALQGRGVQVQVAAFDQDTHRGLKAFPFTDLTPWLGEKSDVDLPGKRIRPL